MTIDRRMVLSGVLVGAAATSLPTMRKSSAQAALAPLPNRSPPISRDERLGRIGNAQALMRQLGFSAILLEPCASMVYFSGIHWRRSERPTCVIIPAEGEIGVVTPFFEEPSVRETLSFPADVRTWLEHEDALAVVAGWLRERKLASGPVGIEETTRYFIVDGLMRKLPGIAVRNGAPVVRGCRLIKTPAEIALMQYATDITIAAYRHTIPQVVAGMRPADISAIMKAAHEDFGAVSEFEDALIGEAAAYPHGSDQPQIVRQGEIVLMDCGCSVEGYQSDISRTFVFGAPTKRQREVWGQVQRGQQIAFGKAQIGTTAGDVDAAVRTYYQSLGYGPEYRLPGLSHRTGHGIGLDGHEPFNLVKNETSRLEPGMCFSDEPGLYLPGEFGVRLEDCFHMTEAARYGSRPPRSRSSSPSDGQDIPENRRGPIETGATVMKRFSRVKVILLTAAMAVFVPTSGIAAVNSAPQPVPYDDPIPAARDVPYPGTLRVAVDATDVTRGLFRVDETIPVSGPGPLTLLYPKWLPGEHGPIGPIASLAGLTITAGGRPIAWKRDPVDVYAFTVDVPAGAGKIEARFQFVSPTDAGQGRIDTTPDMLHLQWSATTLYPAGYFVRDIPVEASVTLPVGFRSATALETTSAVGETLTYKPVAYDMLIDSPLYAGRYFRREELCPNVFLNVVADTPKQIEIKPDILASHRNLCQQAVKLFGARHFDHYDFLFSISDRMGGIGLEHHRSSEDGVGLGYFTEPDQHLGDRDLLPHEFTHSWNGKFRRPADLWTPDYRTPMRDSLLWVYESQTQFWGEILAVRSGLMSKTDLLDELAAVAASYSDTAGRAWRTVEDTTNDPIMAQRRPKPWPTWQRSEDYYDEGALTWLDANALIDRLSQGKKSMNDFARAFFGMNDADFGELTYGFNDVVAILNTVQPYDWAGFLQQRIYALRPRPPLDWIAQAGYRLDFTAEPNHWVASGEKDNKRLDLTFSLGMQIGRADGVVSRVTWDGPAFNAGITTGTTVVAIDDHAYSDDVLKDAVADAAKTKVSIRMILKQGNLYRSAAIGYFGGLIYPHLVKIGQSESALDRLLKTRR